jgi:hypothetical protein
MIKSLIFIFIVYCPICISSITDHGTKRYSLVLLILCSFNKQTDMKILLLFTFNSNSTLTTLFNYKNGFNLKSKCWLNSDIYELPHDSNIYDWNLWIMNNKINNILLILFSSTICVDNPQITLIPLNTTGSIKKTWTGLYSHLIELLNRNKHEKSGTGHVFILYSFVYSSHYSARLTAHPNNILLTLLEQPERKRLQRHLPNDLPARFMV